MPRITLPDGSIREFDQPVSGADLAADIGPVLAKAAIAIKLGGEVKDLEDKDAAPNEEGESPADQNRMLVT